MLGEFEITILKRVAKKGMSLEDLKLCIYGGVVVADTGKFKDELIAGFFRYIEEEYELALDCEDEDIEQFIDIYYDEEELKECQAWFDKYLENDK